MRGIISRRFGTLLCRSRQPLLPGVIFLLSAAPNTSLRSLFRLCTTNCVLIVIKILISYIKLIKLRGRNTNQKKFGWGLGGPFPGQVTNGSGTRLLKTGPDDRTVHKTAGTHPLFRSKKHAHFPRPCILPSLRPRLAPMSCACGATDNLKICACNVKLYCSRACQKIDRRAHAVTCAIWHHIGSGVAARPHFGPCLPPNLLWERFNHHTRSHAYVDVLNDRQRGSDKSNVILSSQASSQIPVAFPVDYPDLAYVKSWEDSSIKTSRGEVLALPFAKKMQIYLELGSYRNILSNAFKNEHNVVMTVIDCDLQYIQSMAFVAQLVEWLDFHPHDRHHIWFEVGATLIHGSSEGVMQFSIPIAYINRLKTICIAVGAKLFHASVTNLKGKRIARGARWTIRSIGGLT